MTQWTYEGDTGPDRWGTLDPAWALADVGYRQSPVDLRKAVEAAVPSLRYLYGPAEARVDVDRYGIRLRPTTPASIEIDGERVDVLEIHTHTPAEHAVDGRLAPAEVHIVHQDANDGLAVLGVFVESGEENPIIDLFGLDAPEGATLTVDPRHLLPEGGSAIYHYEGSLTTPPCTEGVRWFVLAAPTHASDAQLASMRARQGRTNRPLQDLHGRQIGRG